MTRRHGRIRNAAVAAMLVNLPIAPAGGAADDTRFRCQVMAFAPDGGTGLCATLEYQPGSFTPTGDATAYRTTDGGRTWHRRRSDGLRPVASHALKQLVFSPAYATDNTVYLHAAGRGLLRSTDGGDSWLPAAPAADSATVHHNFTPLPAATLPAALKAPALAFADQAPALISPPVHLPVPGAPGAEAQFLATTGATFVATLEPATDGPVGSARSTFYACDAALACATRLFTFPAGHDWQEGWLAPDFATSGRIFAITFAGQAQHVTAWLSTDRGRTFTRWQSLDAFLRPLRNAAWPVVTIAAHPARRTMFARISHQPFPHEGPVRPSPPAAPGEQLLRSDDGGRTWRRVAHGLAFGQQGRDGRIPWDSLGNSPRAAAGALELLADGRLVALGTTFSSYFGVYTSADGGRTWARAAFS